MHDRNRLGEMILSHWLLHLPQMVEELRKNNQLEQALREAQERTGDLLYELVSVQKMDYQAAWDIATREWAFLSTEDRPPQQPQQPCAGNSTPSPNKPPPATSE